MNNDIVSIANKMIESFGNDPFPFIKHLEYFQNNGMIDKYSIAQKWSDITGRSFFDTVIRGSITVQGANYGLNSCPYMSQMNAANMMQGLKHPCDTGIVNADGSINRKKLMEFVKDAFDWSPEHNTFILSQSLMNRFILRNINRDSDKWGINYNLSRMILLPSYPQIAQAEWDEFFNIYTDIKMNAESYVTLKRFLMFYYKPEELYAEILTHKQINFINSFVYVLLVYNARKSRIPNQVGIAIIFINSQSSLLGIPFVQPPSSSPM
jgi:hypothetical protein